MRSLALVVLLLAPRAFAGSYETVPPGEAEAAAQIAALIAGTVSKEHRDTGRAHRDAHAKAHGCVRASVRVEPVLPPELRQGIFQEGRVYKAWIRYSNGSGRSQNDAVGDGRGMAVKLIVAPGVTQDFLMINGPAFFVRDAAEYVEFTKAANAGKPMRFFLGLNPLRWRLHELGVVLALTRAKLADPLTARYWSMTPFLMGDSGPAKFSARPCGVAAPLRLDPKNPDFLRAALSARLKDDGACFDFLVQLRAKPESMPVEDPTVAWSETAAPFLKLATIDIPAQRFESPEQQAFCENLSMNPWHAVPEHRPLGGVNRVRKVVYEEISKLRHELNGAPRAEPTGDETFPPGPARVSFVNPALDAGPDVVFEELRPFARKLKAFVAERTRPGSGVGHVSIYFRDLNNGPWFGVNEKEQFSPASLLKVPIMMTLFKEAEAAPELLGVTLASDDDYAQSPDQGLRPEQMVQPGRSYTIDELIELMVVHSDNRAHELLLSFLDRKSYRRLYEAMNLNPVEVFSRTDAAMSVKAYASFFRILYNASYLNRAMSNKALELLSRSSYKAGLVAGLPPGTAVAHKFGERRGVRDVDKQLHDCGIVYLPRTAYSLCVMTRGDSLDALTAVIRDASALVYAEVSTPAPR